MTNKIQSADASFYYHENSIADFARMDSSTMYGNLADVMKNATVLNLPTKIIDTVVILSPAEDSRTVMNNPGANQRRTSGGDVKRR